MLVIVQRANLHIRSEMQRKVDERFGGQEILKSERWANCFGKQSLGVGQIRGNGALALTKDELYFMMAMPQQEYAVSLKSISEVSLVKSFLGKTIFKPLLCIEWDSGATRDSIAFAVKNPEVWKEAIEKNLEGEGKRPAYSLK